MFERFTDRGRRVLVLAQEEARLLNHNFIGTEHILLGLIGEGEGVAAKALAALGIHLEAVRDKVAETIQPANSSTTGSPPFTPRAKKVLELSLREALQLGHNYIGTEHLLLGLVREGEGVAVQVLIGLGADLARVRQQVILLLTGHPARYRELQDPTLAGLAGSGSARHSGPRCPACRTLLEGQVAYRVLPVAPEPDQAVGPLQVAFVYCRRCGVTIAHTPAGPDHPGSMVSSGRLVARAGSHGRPPVPARDFPDELWNAPPPASVPPTELVDVRHSGRFREDGKLQGIVSGSTVDVTLELPRSASSATGTLDDRAVNVHWKLSYDSGNDDSGLPATLEGTVGDQRVDLRGVFRRSPDYWFDGAWIEGTLADEHLTASIERASGGYGSTDTIVANGTLGKQAFEIFAALGGSLERARVRGSYDTRAVHLNLTITAQADANISGSCPTPPAFALLLIASLRYFA